MMSAEHQALGCLKYPLFERWAEADRKAFDALFHQNGIFDDERGPGAHLSNGTRRHMELSYGRWLAFLRDHDTEALEQPPAARLTRPRVASFARCVGAEVRMTTAASVIDGLRYVARLMDDRQDWRWFSRLHRRMVARSTPLNRLANLTPTTDTYRLGIEIMRRAVAQPARDHLLNEVTYRDGLAIALLSLWPIRRRSIASLTTDRHIDIRGNGITLLLHAEDTKSRRSEAFAVPEDLLPHLQHYLQVTRPALLRAGSSNEKTHTALWVSQRGSALTADRIYAAVRQRTGDALAQPMGLHDFRRSAATTMALERPDLASLIPGILQHTRSDVTDRHYKLAATSKAGHHSRKAS